MLTTCWSVKGGSGTTVVVAAMALAAARGAASRVCVADLAGDVASVLGLPDPPGPGLAEWLDAGASVPDDALGRLAVAATDELLLVGRGAAPTSAAWDEPAAGARLARALRDLAGPGAAIADAGTADRGAAQALIHNSDRSILVLRPCYLALRRAVAAPRPSAVVVISEPERALGILDIEEVLGVPVIAEVPWDPAIARAVDAGLITSRMPRRLVRAFREVAA